MADQDMCQYKNMAFYMVFMSITTSMRGARLRAPFSMLRLCGLQI